MFPAKRVRCLSFMLMGLLLAGHVLAQGSTGEITGVVRDSSQAVIPGATVQVVNPATGATRDVVTNDAGVYSIPALPPGTYTVSAELVGFQRQERTGVLLQVQQIARVNFTLTVGEMTQTIEVSGTPTLLTTEDATVGQVIENRRIVELPLNGRSYLQLTALSPGVNINSSAGGATSFQGGHRSRQSITVSGQRNVFNHYTLDGIENTDPNFNTYILLPSIDALQEFKVQSATYPAEFGYAISQINVTTKSGTNQIHGSLFEFLRNDKLDARNFFDDPNKPIPPFKRNQFGGTVGGPILQNKLFFFGNYEGLREVKTLTSLATVPTASQREGDLSGLKSIYDPATRVHDASGKLVAQPFAGNIIPKDRMDAIALKAMNNYWPMPNLPGSVRNYLNDDPRRTTSDQYMTRIDFNQAQNLSWYGRWSSVNDTEYTPASFPDQGTHTKTRADQLLVGSTLILPGNIVNSARFGWTRFDNKVIGTNSYVNDINGEVLGIANINLGKDPAFWGIPVFGISGFTGFGDRNHIYLTHNNLFEVHDDISWVRGKHIIKLGAVVEPIHYNQLGNQFAVGNITFNGSSTELPGSPGKTGEGFADFLLGLPYQPTVPVKAADARMRSVYWAGYVSDSFKVTDNLTLDYGIRYEYLAPFRDMNDQAVNLWDPYGPNPILVRASNNGEGRDPYEDQMVRFTRAEMVRDGRMGAGLVKPDRNNWAPRIGLAYNWRSNTVIRAGFGVFYAMIDLGNSIYDMSRTLAGLRRDYTNAEFPDLTLAQPFRTGPEANIVPLPQPLILANAYDSRTSYVEQWTLDIQHSFSPDLLLGVAYVGSQGHRLKKFVGLNLPPPGPGSIDPRRPHQQFGYIQYPNTIGNSNYNALQARLERRMSGGLTVLSAYTFGKSIDDGSAVRSGSGENFMSNDPNNLGPGERARSAFDVRHRWVTSTLYELPFLRDSKNLVSKILGGWQLGGILTLESGMAASPELGSEIANVGFSGYRPNAVGDPNLGRGNQTVERFFNTAAYVIQPIYTYGNAGRNVIEGPGIISVDMSVVKRVLIAEEKFFEFRSEIFNVPNHPIFGFPNTNMASRTYGMLTGTRMDSRQIQFALRLVF